MWCPQALLCKVTVSSAVVLLSLGVLGVEAGTTNGVVCLLCTVQTLTIRNTGLDPIKAMTCEADYCVGSGVHALHYVDCMTVRFQLLSALGLLTTLLSCFALLILPVL